MAVAGFDDDDGAATTCGSAAAATPDKSSGAEREVGGAGSEEGGGWVVEGEGVPPEVRVEGPPSSSVSMLLSARREGEESGFLVAEKGKDLIMDKTKET